MPPQKQPAQPNRENHISRPLCSRCVRGQWNARAGRCARRGIDICFVPLLVSLARNCPGFCFLSQTNASMHIENELTRRHMYVLYGAYMYCTYAFSRPLLQDGD